MTGITDKQGWYAMIEETERLGALHALEILDTPKEKPFDKIVERALGYMPGASIAAISLVDKDRQWFKASVGLDVSETPRNVAFCDHVVRSMAPMVIEDAQKDRRFAANPLVTGEPAIRFYAGVPLSGGMGALCVIGTEPRQATEAEMAQLVRLAAYVDIHLTLHGAKTKLKPRA